MNPRILSLQLLLLLLLLSVVVSDTVVTTARSVRPLARAVVSALLIDIGVGVVGLRVVEVVVVVVLCAVVVVVVVVFLVIVIVFIGGGMRDIMTRFHSFLSCAIAIISGSER